MLIAPVRKAFDSPESISLWIPEYYKTITEIIPDKKASRTHATTHVNFWAVGVFKNHSKYDPIGLWVNPVL